MTSLIYLDNSATTLVRDEVRQAMAPYQAELYGNGSSVHQMGLRSRLAIEKARQAVAQLLNAQPDEIFFTPCATYSNNAALLGRARYVEENGLGRHIITTAIEHSSAIGPIQHLQSRGWRVSLVNVDRYGVVDVQHLKSLLTYETSIISVMWGNNEVGSLQPVAEIGELARQKNIFFHTDAVQVVGKIPLDVQVAKVDTLALSGHKFHAPKGIGALYIRKGVEVMPIVFGGGQENGMFPGTENVANIVALGKAAELAILEQDSSYGRLRNLQKILIEGLLRYSHVSLTGPNNLNARVPGHVSIVVANADGQQLVEEADSRGICISSASACSSRSGHPSHVLKALGLSAAYAAGSLRITVGSMNSEDEIRRALSLFSEILSPQQAGTPFVQYQSALIA